MIRTIVPAAFCAACLLVHPAAASDPVTYQGVLDRDGQPTPDGTYSMFMQIYSVETGGTPIGQEVHNVDVKDGLFTVEFDPDGFVGEALETPGPLWLRILVRDPTNFHLVPLEPRQRIGASPRANMADRATLASGLPSLTAEGGVMQLFNETQPSALPVRIKAQDGSAIFYADSSAMVQLRGTPGFGPRIRMMHQNPAEGDWYIGVRQEGELEGRLLVTNGFAPNPLLSIGIDDLVIGTEITVQHAITINGSDLAERFDVSAREGVEPAPGMVVSIDPDHAGRLAVSAEAYDRKVAGVISGAGGISPALNLHQPGTIADGEVPVAMTGRVYVWADAGAGGAIGVGDLLTSSSTPGHAMRASDGKSMQGTIIGKAMTPLESGRGLVLVLVNLH